MNLPWSKWYWRDWQSDTGLRSCSLAARGLWIEMLCIMAQCERYGYMINNGKAIDIDALSRIVGEDKATLKAILQELINAGVPSIDDETGAYYSRRLVREMQEHNRAKRYGKLGGSPLLKKEETEAKKLDARDSINPTLNPTLIPNTGVHDGYTLKECHDAAACVGLKPDQVEAFYNHYASIGWIKGNRKITSLPHALSFWKANQSNFTKHEPRRRGANI